ncbi:MAG TPA: HEAT repeat domain-containing protein [Capsulimonadaceae bacterium]|nr:HEAT repeat domain-containing protein [Capsulimonadaceae bacterium]
MNKHQKKVYRVGEHRIGPEDIAKLLELSCSANPGDRLEAATWLCPCHVRRRIDTVWEALYRLMEDQDWRVRRQAWHTIEDGGKPSDPEAVEKLEAIFAREAHPKVRQMARSSLDKALGSCRDRADLIALHAATREHRERGKCDFCGESNVLVDLALDTLIPTDDLARAARICGTCAKTV